MAKNLVKWPVLGVALAWGLTSCQASASAPEIDLGSGPAKVGTIKANSLKGVTLTLTSWGGVFQDGQVKAASDPFAAESGATMLQDGPTEYSKVKAQVEGKNVTWDIVDTDVIWASKQCGPDGLFMDLDMTIVDTSHAPANLVGKCYIPAMQYGYVVVYNTTKYPTPPTGWVDFFDTTKFPGKRAIAGFEDIAPGVFEGALLADGVSPDKLYPLDVDRAYKKINPLRSSLIYWKTGAESEQMLESGEADMALVWSGRAYAAAKNGAKIKPVWNQALIIADALGVPKNAKNPKAAFAYLNYYLGATQQAKLSELTSYSPVHDEAKPQLDAVAKQYLTTDPQIRKQMIPSNSEWWSKNYDTELVRWLDWLKG
ncbi:MAG: ABC transporter [Candidatus Lumbricidophila eiseniae]|uniref:ABC transporter n=1 Tax=Candidatus Lumbricidiphila eiseniae TaxID=1969409 RepID=A0A2A6FNT9_9MICO|nr:MAG: ABC transporter [Candidatus Lumbricidophila eiseniae]